MKTNARYSDKEWEELASLLSDEQSGNNDLLGTFIAGDSLDTAKKWKEMGNIIDDKEINVDKAWNKVHAMIDESGYKSRNDHTRIIFTARPFMKIAATVLTIIGLSFAGTYLINPDLFSKKIIIASGNDQKNIQVSLPDGSRIFLNSNSQFTYLSNFGKRGRNVSLSGEAFFEIASDASNPFVINAGNARVRVVGTSFNIITSNSESAVEVFVKTGRVMLSSNTGSRSLELDPGYIGTMNSEKSDKKINENPNYLSWNTGLLIYNGQKLDVVFSDLKRVYNMDIEVNDKAILENRWTSPIDNQPQETIIRLICASFNLSYTKDGNVYHLAKK